MFLTSHNRCNLPPWIIASRHYNQSPQPLEIQGARHDQRLLLEKLAQVTGHEARGALFHDFMDVRFQLHQWQREDSPTSRKSLKNSYLQFLRGWQFDSNSVEGAVLKSWVESRFGLLPTFHREPINNFDSAAYFHYSHDCMRGAIRTNAILAQLDLLYEFVQHELTSRFPDSCHVTLYRGIYDFSEHRIIEETGKNSYILQLNSLNSFTLDFERAWEFGTRVLDVNVPLTKIFFLSGLLPKALLTGEDEVMVIGGEYEVRVLIGG